MFCRKKKGKPFDAEIWWKRWSNDKTLTGTLSFPSGWKPLFVDSIQASNETTIDRRHSSIYFGRWRQVKPC